MSRKYTPLHPAVVQARWEVEQVEAKIARCPVRHYAGGSPHRTVRNSGLESAEVQRLRAQIAQADLEIAALKRESASTVRPSTRSSGRWSGCLNGSRR